MEDSFVGRRIRLKRDILSDYDKRILVPKGTESVVLLKTEYGYRIDWKPDWGVIWSLKKLIFMAEIIE